MQVTDAFSQTSFAAGTNVTYTMVASNAGRRRPPARSVTDTFPPPLTGVSWSGSDGRLRHRRGHRYDHPDQRQQRDLHRDRHSCPASATGTLTDTVTAPPAAPPTRTRRTTRRPRQRARHRGGSRRSPTPARGDDRRPARPTPTRWSYQRRSEQRDRCDGRRRDRQQADQRVLVGQHRPLGHRQRQRHDHAEHRQQRDLHRHRHRQLGRVGNARCDGQRDRTGGATDPNTSNNVAGLRQTVTNTGADVQVTDASTRRRLLPARGDLHHRGHQRRPGDATGAVVTDTFPATLTGVSWSGSDGTPARAPCPIPPPWPAAAA